MSEKKLALKNSSVLAIPNTDAKRPQEWYGVRMEQHKNVIVINCMSNMMKVSAVFLTMHNIANFHV